MRDLPTTFVAGFHDEDSVRKMKYSPLGQTGLKVSALALGTGSCSQIYGNFDEDEAIRTIQEAIRKGINYIDTGYWYGQGRAETILGEALRDVPRQAYYVGTKCGRYGLQPAAMFDFSAERTLRNFTECLQRLQLDYVDVIQIHDIEFAPSLDVIINETLPALHEIVRTGRATYIGITGYPVSVLKECVERSPIIISTILSYTRLTLIDNTLRDFVPYFQMQGIGLINASAPSMGLLTNSGPPAWHPAHEETKNVCREAANYCKEKGVELGRLAVGYCLKQNGIATNLIGMNTRELLESNLSLLHNGLSKLEETVLEEIQDKFFSKLETRHWENVELNNFRQNKLSY